MIRLSPMKLFSIPLKREPNRGEVRRVVKVVSREAGLESRELGTLKAYPGSLHWHCTMRGRSGTLELTFWPRRGSLWLSVHSRRGAPWVASAVRRVKAGLARRLR